MSAYLFEWLNLLGRWLHMIVGIAWIGASFYFIWLDNHLQPPAEEADAKRGVAGEIWSVHGGGFYHAQKYRVAPETLPPTLHWFKWEAYSTWLSGMFLLILIYWLGADLYLIDKNVADISRVTAIATSAALIVGGWLVYDVLCRSKMGQNERLLSVILFVLVAALAYAVCHLFSGRAAYLHFGAVLGTIMVANVLFVIIPGQKDLVLAKEQNRQPDSIHGIRGKQRSVHNTYITLPVLFSMISNHYAGTFNHQYNWLVLIAISLVGAGIRVFFVQRHFGRFAWQPLLLALTILAGLIVAMAPAHKASEGAGESSAVKMETVQAIISQRCVSCHAASPQQAGFSNPPKGVLLESQADILKHAQAIYQQTVVTRAMPIGNLTAITEAERQQLNDWYGSL